MNRSILKWIDAKFEREINDTKGNQAISTLKCCGLGIVEGTLNAVTIVGGYTVLLIGIASVLNRTKNKA